MLMLSERGGNAVIRLFSLLLLVYLFVKCVSKTFLVVLTISTFISCFAEPFGVIDKTNSKV